MRLIVVLGCLFYLNVMVAASACAQTAREKIFPGGEFFSFAGHPAFILRPESAVAAKENQPWVFYAPTLSAYPDTHEEWMHRQFLAAGIAIAGVDMGEAYGNPESRKVFDRFYDELTQKRGLVEEALFARTQSRWPVGLKLGLRSS